MRKAASVFSLFCGVAMLAVWGTLLVTGNVLELKTTPLEAGFLIAAEFLTASSLIAGGFGLLTGTHWGFRADLAALGLLLYCTVYSVGVFGQKGNLPATGFFVVITTLAAIFCVGFVFGREKGGTQ